MGLNAFIYKSLPFLHAIVHISEFCCIVILIKDVVAEPDFFFPGGDEKIYNGTGQILEIETFVFIGLFSISEFVPFITFLLLFLALPCIVCSCACSILCSESNNCNGGILRSKSFHRFLSLNCNCPCYRARPQLRFQFRFGFLLICFCLRFLAIIGLFLLPFKLFKNLAIVCAISCGFLILQFLLDFYQYRILWNYVPSEDQHPTRTLSRKHKRYLPYHLLGHNRTKTIGDYPCKNNIHCHNRRLEHIMVFHSTDYQPQPRWSEVRSYSKNGIYIGFHQTKPEYAIGIAHSDFQPSMTPPQMLGFGIYFARSLANTFGKARNKGAFICAEIRMGKVKEVTLDQLCEVGNSNTWWDEYDTVYYNQENETRDEFCIKSSSQIIRWVVAINGQYDRKLRDYGMVDEFDDTKCGCC